MLTRADFVQIAWGQYAGAWKNVSQQKELLCLLQRPAAAENLIWSDFMVADEIIL